MGDILVRLECVQWFYICSILEVRGKICLVGGPKGTHGADAVTRETILNLYIYIFFYIDAITLVLESGTYRHFRKLN